MEHLVLTIMGEFNPEIIHELTKLINQYKCSIIDCRMSTLGSQVIINALLAGTWNSIAKFEKYISQLEKKYNLSATTERTSPRKFSQELLPYSVYFIAKDEPSIIHEVTHFFVEQAIEIVELFAESYTSRQTGIKMLSLSLSINIPADTQLSELRERFLLFCDGLNLDGAMETEKG